MKIQSKLGNESLLKRKKTAFLCSRMASEAVKNTVEMWLDGLSPDADCVMCGNHSPMERTVFQRLLDMKIPAILVLAEAMHDCWEAAIETALREERLLIVTHCDGDVHSVSSRSAFDRNMLMLLLADKIVVGYCQKGGNLERVLAGFDHVQYLFLLPEKDDLDNAADGMEQYGETKHNGLKDNDLWSRVGILSNGNVTVELNGFGKETYMKISHENGNSTKGGLGERLMFNRSEFANFYRAIRQIKESFNASDETYESVVVKSESGDVTIDFVPDEDLGMWVLTQSKLLVTNELRSHTIKICTSDLPTFYDLLVCAARNWGL